MNILVTGSAGFIGFNLCKYLLEKNYKVLGLDNYSTGTKKKTNLLKQNFKKNFIFFEGDIRDKKLLKKIFKNCKVIINLAGQVSVQKSIHNILENDSINSQGFLNILDCALKNNVSDVIFASSCSVYGNSNNIPHKENQILNPQSPYAVSKISNEIYSRMFANLYKDFKITGLRFFNVVGPWQSKNSDYGAIMPRWISSFLNNDVPQIYGDGNATRDFIDVLDLSKLIERIMLKENSYLFEIFNVGSGRELSVLDLFYEMKSVMRRLNLNFSFDHPIFKDKREGDIDRSCSNNLKIMKYFDYNKFINIKESIIKILNEEYLIK